MIPNSFFCILQDWATLLRLNNEKRIRMNNLKRFNTTEKVLDYIHTIRGLEKLDRIKYVDGVYFASKEPNVETPYAIFVNFTSQGEWKVSFYYNSKKNVVIEGVELNSIYKEALEALGKLKKI